jgi:hypothetical protein
VIAPVIVDVHVNVIAHVIVDVNVDVDVIVDVDGAAAKKNGGSWASRRSWEGLCAGLTGARR